MSMVILGIEAAARACGAAILQDGTILSSCRTNAGLTHSETLMPMVDQVFQMAGIPKEAVNVIALTNGPGSFTGLRIGAATAKGLAMGLNKPLLPVNTLESLTFSMAVPGLIRVGLMDARRHQVYAAVYQLLASGEDKEILPPSCLSPEEVVKALIPTEGPIFIMGDGALPYAPVLQEALGDRLHLAPAHLRDLSAESTCSLAEHLLQRGATAIPSQELTLEYLRKPQAEREREERLSREAEAKNHGEL